MKAYRISEILYVVIAIISVKEAIALWTVRPEKPTCFWGLQLWLSLCIFRSYYRKKFNRRKP